MHSELVRTERMLPVTSRWARFGPTNRKWFMHIPPGGVCLSAFLIVRNREGDVLPATPGEPMPPGRRRGACPHSGVRELEEGREWILPGESPAGGRTPERRRKASPSRLGRTAPRETPVDRVGLESSSDRAVHGSGKEPSPAEPLGHRLRLRGPQRSPPPDPLCGGAR